MSKGIVMEVSRRTAVVMTRDGRFLKLKVAPDVRIGQEIEVTSQAPFGMHAVRWMSVAAAVLLLLVALSYWTVERARTGGTLAAVAYVTIDINPSVEFGIDDQSRVVEAAGINEEGRLLLQEIDVVGRDVEEATEELIRQARPYLDRYAEAGFGEIFIASTIVADMITINQEELQEKVRSVVYRVVQSDGQSDEATPSGQSVTEVQGAAGADAVSAQPSEIDGAARQRAIKVATLSVPKEVREDAKEKGISAGKLAVGLIIADRTGQEVPLSDIESKSITQLAEENGWLDSLLQQDQDSIRKNLEQLYQHSVKGKGNIGFEKPASWSQDDSSKGKLGHDERGLNNNGKGGHGRDNDRGVNSKGKGNNERDDHRGVNSHGKGDNVRGDERGVNSKGKSDGSRGDERGQGNKGSTNNDPRKNNHGKNDNKRHDDRHENSDISINPGKSNGGKNGNHDERGRMSGNKGKGEGKGTKDNGKSTPGSKNRTDSDDRAISNGASSDSRNKHDPGKINDGKKGHADNKDRSKKNGASDSGKADHHRNDTRGPIRNMIRT